MISTDRQRWVVDYKDQDGFHIWFNQTLTGAKCTMKYSRGDEIYTTCNLCKEKDSKLAL